MRYPLLCLTVCLNLLIFSTSAFAEAENSCYSDYIPPVAVCDAHTVVALGANGVATVYAYNFDDGSYDNCHISHFKAARMWPGWCPYGVVDDTEFRPYVQFCCEDIGGPIWIIVRVFDEHGNYNDCMVEVTVQEGPGSLHCPYDKSISCDYWFDWNDLYDPWNTFFGWPTSGGGCNDPNIHVEVHDHRTCGSGYIKRIFSTGGGGGYGGGGYGDQCIQYIWVNNNHPFNGNSIHWPPHYEASGCDMHYADPHSLPYPYNFPTWYDAPCSLIGYSYDDQVFEFVEGVCKKILRTWTIIDWCQFDPHHPYYGGVWTYLQVIKLVDHDKPWFENCHDVTVNGLEPHCKGRFEHHPAVWDNCTPQYELKYEYKIDLWGNGSIDIKKNGHKYIDEILPLGEHKAFWYVDDGCGNVASCSFKVKVVDKKPPTPICFANLSTAIMPIGGMMVLWARDYDASSFDNCTHPDYLKFSFSPDVTEASRTFTCDDIGENALQIYVTDQYGNQAYCNVTISIADNNMICPEMNPLQGIVETFTGEAIGDAEVALYKVMPDNTMLMDMMKLSDDDGAYRVGFGTTQYDRMLDVTKPSESMEGISTLDMIYLQQHILGIAQLGHPAAELAADVDGSGRVGVNDLLMLRDAFLSGGRTLGGTILGWNFYPKSCEGQPDGLAGCDFEIEIDHNNPPPQTESLDFIGFKLGDINGDVMHNPGNRIARKYPVGAKYNSQTGAFDFIAMEPVSMLGMQMSVKPSMVGTPEAFRGGSLNITGQNCFVDEDQRVVNLAWVTPSIRSVAKGEVLFSMPMSEIQAGKLKSWDRGWYSNELYLGDKTALPIEITTLYGPAGFATGENDLNGSDELINVRSAQSGLDEVEAFFAPNPMSEAGLLYYRLNESQDVTLEVFSASQQVVDTRKLSGVRGLNEVVIDSRDLGQPGVYLYRLTVGDKTITGRIVYVE